MAKPTLYAQLFMFDSINLLTDFPLIGEEEVTIVFETPGISEPARYVLRVFEISNVQQSDNRMAVGYTLACISAEHFHNGGSVRESFQGLLSDFAVHVARDYLATNKKIRVEPTKGLYNIVTPSWKPLEAIDYARKNSVSKTYAGTCYVFYETQAGFTFASVEYLCASQQVGSRVFKFPYMTANEKDSASYRAVIEHEVLTRNDSIELINEGVLQAQTMKFDLLTKQVSNTEYSALNDFKDFRGADERTKFPQSAQFAKSFGSPSRYMTFRDSSRPDDYTAEAYAARNAFVQLLNSNVTRLLVHGDSGIKAGDLVELDVPEVLGTTVRKHMDPLHAGRYIVLRLRHLITLGPKPLHELVLDVGRVGTRR